MVTPNPMLGEQYYKVGDWVTFAWNYTSLSVTPSAIDVLASCTANQATYTIAVNISASQTQVLWDTKNAPSGQSPFLTEKYTLLIYDAELSVSATARAGYLGAYSGFTFGMYTPQPYTPWAGKRSHTTLFSRSLLTTLRLPVCKLQRCPLSVRKNDHQGPTYDDWNNYRLASLFYVRIWSMVDLASLLAYIRSGASASITITAFFTLQKLFILHSFHGFKKGKTGAAASTARSRRRISQSFRSILAWCFGVKAI